MTKLANKEAIQKAKSALIEHIKKSLDLNQIRKILEDQHNIDIGDDIEVHNGEVVIHNNQVAYKMEFEILLSLSVLLDSEGNYIPPEDSPGEAINQVGNAAEDIIQDASFMDA